MPDAGESHVRGQVLERTSTLILEIADSVVIVLDVENTLERLLNYQVTKFFFFPLETSLKIRWNLAFQIDENGLEMDPILQLVKGMSH